MESEKLTYSIAETALILGLSRYLTYEAARRGQLPVIRFGQRWVVSKYGLEKMLKDAGSGKKLEH